MKTYNLLGGGTITAESNQEIVENLNLTSLFGRRKNLNEFMVETAKACQVQTGAEVRTNNINSFVEDLIKAGFLTES
ncbi:MAG: hypothetical protein M1419_05540 [Bacteroidetes bacterium]|nr:hypothetical protein [Bacteroidota bacterium]